MKKIKLTSYFVLAAFLTFLTVFVSIVQKSYFNLKKPQKIVENNELLKEFNPELDLSVISTIELKDKNTDEPFDFSIIKSAADKKIVPTAKPSLKPTLVPTVAPSTENPNEILEEEFPIEEYPIETLEEETL